MKGGIQYFLGAVLWLSTVFAQNQDAEIISAQKRIENNAFTVSRGLTQYDLALGDKFTKALKELPLRSRWLDIGAGEALAQRHYFEEGGERKQIELVALSVEKPFDDSLDRFEKKKGGSLFKYLSGKYFEDYDVLILKKFDLITDVYGAVSYSIKLSAVIKRIGDVLKIGGKAFTLIGESERTHLKTLKEAKGFNYANLNLSNVDLSNSLLILENEARSSIPLSEWFSTFKCLEVQASDGRGLDEAKDILIEMTKTCEDVKVTALELVNFKDTTPPFRRFRMANRLEP